MLELGERGRAKEWPELGHFALHKSICVDDIKGIAHLLNAIIAVCALWPYFMAIKH